MENLVLQTSGILLPISVFVMLGGNSFRIVSVKGKVIFAIVLSFSVLGCMSFAVPLNGFHIDMRDIPLFLSILYGGYDVGTAVTVLAIVYRFCIGGTMITQSLMSLLVHVIVVPFVFFEYKRFQNRPHRQRVLAATKLGFLLSVVATLVSGMDSPAQFEHLKVLEFYLVFMAANTFGMTMVVFLIEKYRETNLLREHLHQAEKLNVVSQLAAAVAHEVRNPLTVVGGFVKLLEDNLDEDKRHMYARLISDELARAESIISDYLTFARPEVAQEETSLADVKMKILSAVSLMNSYGIVNNVAIHLELTDGLFVRTHKQKFMQVIVNILKNGIEAMPNGGNIHIRLFRGNESMAVIEIADEGIGMSREQMKLLGSPFYSLKESGTGLGLMVSYRIIHSMGGQVTVESEPGKGTCFRITVPLEAEDSSQCDAGIDSGELPDAIASQ